MAALMVLASSLQAVITDVAAAALQPYLDDRGLWFAIEITWQQQYGHCRRSQVSARRQEPRTISLGSLILDPRPAC
jgi:hypothetical protein